MLLSSSSSLLLLAVWSLVSLHAPTTTSTITTTSSTIAYMASDDDALCSSLMRTSPFDTHKTPQVVMLELDSLEHANDEHITHLDTDNNPQVVIRVIIIRARAKQLIVRVSSFLSTPFSIIRGNINLIILLFLVTLEITWKYMDRGMTVEKISVGVQAKLEVQSISSLSLPRTPEAAHNKIIA